LVERGASCMKIVPFVEYFGWWLESGARCACHARQERTNIDVYGNKHKPCCLKLLVYSFCDFLRKWNSYYARCILQIHLLFLSFYLLFGFAFSYILFLF
jgi:hypothetical protein